MRASLTKLTEGLDDLRRYLDALTLEAGMLASVVPQGRPTESERMMLQLREQLSRTPNKRRFDYTTAIVSLYGFWEQYVEDLLRAYVTALAKWVPRYERLPERIVQRHLRGSVTLLTRIGEAQFDPGAEKDVVTRLYGCLNNSPEYELNTDAFVLHRANLRREIVEQLASGLGILNLCQRVRDSQALQSWMSKRFPGRSRGSVPTEEVFRPLDELAQRRNEASHGMPGEILSNELVRELIESIEKLGNGIFEVVYSDALPFEAASGLALGKPIRIFANRIVGIRLVKGDIAVGDRILVKTRSKKRPFKESSVLEIQINNEQKETVTADAAVDIGVELDVNVRPSYELYLLPVGRSWIAGSDADTTASTADSG